MNKSNYGFWKKVDFSFEQAIERVTEELQKEGFGIISQVDVTSTLKNKINVDFKPYRILGACSPIHAHNVLQNEEQIGLLLPCNFIVYVNDAQETIVAAINPMESMKAVQNPKLEETAQTIQSKIIRVVSSL